MERENFHFRPDRRQEQGLSPQVSHCRCFARNKQRSRILDRDQVALERDQAKLDREQATLERDEAILDRDLLMAERVQDQRLQESIANCEQIKSELERLLKEEASGREWEREKEDYG